MIVYCVVNVDDEYGHWDLHGVFSDIFKAEAFIDDPTKHRHRDVGCGGFRIVEEEVQ